MTTVEQCRLYEIVFYKYFENQSEETMNNTEFWKCIWTICQSYDVDSLLVTKATRILMAKENAPSDFETWYLLSHTLGMSVRQLNRFTGIYWQKQKKFEQMYNDGVRPDIKRRITDAAMFQNIKDFLNAICIIYGSLKYLPTNALGDIDISLSP